jgi:hypothetical protein
MRNGEDEIVRDGVYEKEGEKTYKRPYKFAPFVSTSRFERSASLDTDDWKVLDEGAVAGNAESKLGTIEVVLTRGTIRSSNMAAPEVLNLADDISNKQISK